MIGLKDGEARLEAYSIEWKEIAKETINNLRSILGNVAIDIQHVGSTSIVGLMAKSIIDIEVGVKSIQDVLNASEDIRKEYEDLKMQLVSEYPKDRVAYTSMKAGFIQRIMSGYKQNYVSFNLQPSHIEYNLFCYK